MWIKYLYSYFFTTSYPTDIFSNVHLRCNIVTIIMFVIKGATFLTTNQKWCEDKSYLVADLYRGNEEGLGSK